MRLNVHSKKKFWPFLLDKSRKKHPSKKIFGVDEFERLIGSQKKIFWVRFMMIFREERFLNEMGF